MWARTSARSRCDVGDGHPVVVYPGLGAGALTTSHLRSFLRNSGYTVHDWEGGVNTGPEGILDDWLGNLDDRVRELHRSHGRKVSLIGWSLGGVYAREIAKRCPQSVRQVITLGTPFASLGGGNHAGTVFKLLNKDKAHLPPELQARLRATPAGAHDLGLQQDRRHRLLARLYREENRALGKRRGLRQPPGHGDPPAGAARHRRSAVPARGQVAPAHGAQLTQPVAEVASTTMPKAMRYQAKGVKLWVEM